LASARGDATVRGTILTFDANRGTGLVSGDDGRRYTLADADWRGGQWPAAGDAVDFVPEGDTARAAFPLAQDGERMSWSQFLWSFDGRIGRRDYWLRFVLPAVIVNVIAQALAEGLQSILLGVVVGVLVFWASIAVGAKRCHDRDRSGWFQLISLIPIVGTMWLIVELGFLRGTPGPNRFGPAPSAQPPPAAGLRGRRGH
jgi:uncharacterized membrane protein YhaH (DUF805 family)